MSNEKQVDKVLHCLYSFDIKQAYHCLATMSLPLSATNTLELVLAPALRRIGNDWHQKKISITQEHFASQFIRNRLFSFLDVQNTFPGKCKIGFGTSKNETHEGGILLIAAGLALRGTKSYYFGNDIPLVDLLNEAENLKLKSLALSYLFVKNFERDIGYLNKSKVRIILGGPGVLPKKIQSKNIIYLNDDLPNVVGQIQKLI